MKLRAAFPCIRSAFPILAALFLIAGAARAEDQRFVSDDVYTWGDLGGIRLAHTGCDGSLDGRAIDGFDVPGEWIAWRLTLTEPFCFVDSLRNAGTTDDIRHFVTEFILETTVETVSQDSVLTTPGRGLSWSWGNYDWVQSSKIHCLEAGTYMIKITLLSELRTKIDCLDLSGRTIATRPSSWGTIRVLFR